jgi:hypothetical protein
MTIAKAIANATPCAEFLRAKAAVPFTPRVEIIALTEWAASVATMRAG